MAKSKETDARGKDKDAAHADLTLPDTEDALPPVDFTTFLLSLSTSALVSLGEAPEPDGKLHVDLPLARQTIDLIQLLHDKTKGNLTGEEERLLDQMLLDLRLKFVEAAGRAKKKAPGSKAR